MNILVTGGRGFIGTNLVEYLSGEGHTILVLDNMTSGARRGILVDVKYVVGCCSQINELADFNPDVVIHLGEYARVQQSFEEPLYAMKNITSTLPHVLDYCRVTNAKMIYAGSSTKFGNAESPYSISKATNTMLVDSYCKMFDIPYAITYFYNAYGKLECASGVYATAVAKFIDAKKKGLDVVIYGDGMQRRNFTNVKDIVSGISRVMHYGNGDGYGIGSDESYSVLELAQMINNNYRFAAQAAGNRTSATLDTAKTKSLGWEAKRKLHNYIQGELK